MWLLLITAAIMMFALFIVFISGLFRASRRADEGEDRIAGIISTAYSMPEEKGKPVEEVSEALILM